MNNWYNDDIRNFFRAVLSLRDEEECLAFFTDICTVTEMQSISQRLRVAMLLREGTSYNSITAETGVSAATISRVSRSLEYGSGGYETVIARMEGQGNPGREKGDGADEE
ncbi:MAG: TrpR YerC/YecD [Oscillospiraceae bacterium]|nr:TrpR YerC/YecD [Oscillospiraceae bacterium]